MSPKMPDFSTISFESIVIYDWHGCVGSYKVRIYDYLDDISFQKEQKCILMTSPTTRRCLPL